MIAAYEHAQYIVFATPDILLCIDAPNPALDALLEAHGAATAAYLTAANPRGEKRSDAANQAAMAKLRASLGWAFHEGEGRDPEGRWPAEPSLLLLGISRAEAEALGRSLEQNAILFIEKGGAPQLVLLEKMRLVLDTQIWLDWLVFDDPSTEPLKAALAAGRAEIFIDAACRAELERVLAYPLGRRSVDVATCLAECLRFARLVNTTAAEKLPACRDPDDQKFVELAAAVRAGCLVTRDRALLALDRRRLPFRIVAPDYFRR